MNNIKTEKIFVYLCLIFGSIFMLITPPFQSPDEDSHFKKAYVISRFQFFPKIENNISGFYLPVEMINYIENMKGNMSNLDFKYEYSDILLNDRLPKNFGDVKFVNFSTINTLPLVYIAPSIGINVGKIISYIIGTPHSVSTQYLLYFARLFSIIAYVIIMYYSIKISPILKKTFCFLGLFPMCLFLASTLNYDAYMVSLTLLSLAMIFRLLYNEKSKFNYRYLIGFSIIGFILLSIKPVYLPVYLLLLLVPKEKFRIKSNIKNNKLFSTILLIITIVMLYIIFKLPGFLSSISTKNAESVTSQQIAFIIDNPIKYMKILVNNIINQRYFQLSTMIGTFGLIDTYMPTYIISLFLIFYILLGICEYSKEKIKFSIKFRIFSVLILIISVFGIYTALYLGWTAQMPGYGIGSTEITGVQGRYFLPLLILPIIIFGNKIINKSKIIKNIGNIIVNNYFICTIITLTLSTITILMRFWW